MIEKAKNTAMQRDLDKVISECKEAVKKATGKERAAIFERMGDAYRDMDKGPKAVICYEEAMGAGGDHIDLIEKYTDILGLSGGQEKAIKLLEETINKTVIPKDRARLLAKKAYFIRFVGKYEEAKKVVETALEILVDLDPNDPEIRHSLAEANAIMGICHWELGDLKKAQEYFNTALGFYEKEKDYRGIARIKNNTGLTLLYTGEVDQALKNFEDALKAIEACNIGGDSGMVLTNIGLIFQIKGEFERSEEYYKKSIKIQMAVNKHYGVHLAQADLADMLVDKGEYLKARGWAERALKGFQDVKDESRMAMVMNTMALIELEEGDPKKAERTVDKALAMAREHKAYESLGISLRVKGTIVAARKDFEASEKFLKESIEVFKKSQFRYGEGRSLLELALISLAKGDKAQAKAAASSARKILAGFGAKRELSILDGVGL